jgi:hypothetical protein
MRKCVAVVAVLFGFGSVLAPPPALASGGGLKPSQAPLITIGTHYFGNTEHEDNAGDGSVDLWRLPSLINDDLITVAWNNHGGNRMCLAENVDDYSWDEESGLCNGSEGYETAGSGSARTTISAKVPTSSAYLEFTTDCCEQGPYDFTVESIQHAIGVGLARVLEIPPVTTLLGSADLANAQPVPDGLTFTLTASWVTPANKASHSRTFTSTSSAGNLSFPVSLPTTAQGKNVSFTVTRPADPQYLAAASAAVEIPVTRAAPPPLPSPPPARHHRHHRHRHHKHHHRHRR